MLSWKLELAKLNLILSSPSFARIDLMLSLGLDSSLLSLRFFIVSRGTASHSMLLCSSLKGFVDSNLNEYFWLTSLKLFYKSSLMCWKNLCVYSWNWRFSSRVLLPGWHCVVNWLLDPKIRYLFEMTGFGVWKSEISASRMRGRPFSSSRTSNGIWCSSLEISFISERLYNLCLRNEILLIFVVFN